MENTKLIALLENNTKLTAEVIKTEGFTKEEVAEYNAALKAKKAEMKLAALQLEKCQISYKGKSISFKPSLCSSDNGAKFVI